MMTTVLSVARLYGRVCVALVLALTMLSATLTVTNAAYAEPSSHCGGNWLNVEHDDTLSKIANRYGTTVHALMNANNLQNPDVIHINQSLCIPDSHYSSDDTHYNDNNYDDTDSQETKGYEGYGGSDSYKTLPGDASCAYHYYIKSGDTLAEIAYYYGIPTRALADVNHIADPARIDVGILLCIPHADRGHYDPDDYTTDADSSYGTASVLGNEGTKPIMKPIEKPVEPVKHNVIPDSSLCANFYSVVAGDTLGKISKYYGIDYHRLAYLSGIHDVNKIEIMDSICIPAGYNYTAPVPMGTMGEPSSSSYVDSEPAPIYEYGASNDNSGNNHVGSHDESHDKGQYNGEVYVESDAGMVDDKEPTYEDAEPGFAVETTESHAYYTIVLGDTWKSLAEHYGVNIETILRVNGRDTEAAPLPGEIIIVPF